MKYLVRCFQISSDGHIGVSIYEHIFDTADYEGDDMGGIGGASLSIAVRAGMDIRSAIEDNLPKRVK